MQTSQFVFPRPLGGQLKLDSYLKHFRRIRDLAGIPKDFRPNYCLRDTIATRLLSSGLSLNEVAHQLGYTPGSPMTLGDILNSWLQLSVTLQIDHKA
ncbi:MAG: tyrosine-type recombinase/integrase [SAR324 cluster bacterium]|nr:tyrosine-type recombinase/integrase [SAR324 cluster bacterium]